MKKKIKLEYYVIITDFNTKKVMEYNIFYDGLVSKIYNYVKKKYIESHEDLKKFLEIDFISNYYARAEYEILVGGLFDEFPMDYTKIDIWYQIKPNLEIITRYVEEKMQIKYGE